VAESVDANLACSPSVANCVKWGLDTSMRNEQYSSGKLWLCSTVSAKDLCRIIISSTVRANWAVTWGPSSLCSCISRPITNHIWYVSWLLPVNL